MPELPEVETIARALAPGLVGRVVVGIEAPDRKVLAAPKTRAAWARAAAGRTVTAVSRRAKLLLVHLGPAPAPGSLPGAPDLDEDTLLFAFHLKMTGRFHIAPTDAPPPAYARLLVRLDDGQSLVFSDMRRFGTARLLTPQALSDWPFYATLGPEPWDMTPEAFEAALSRRTTRIKAVLLDQTVMAGIGNIYADESLFAAGIRPDTPAKSLSAGQRQKLLAAVQAVIGRAIAAGGSTIRDYRTPDGVEGGFQHQFTVYGKAGEPCPGCRAVLVAAKVAGRTSTFCPHCQK
ncbi:formamidopyrimidine-DNA glycosylase [Solidesulfovibrio carbinoliphilus subsp. oakridgensis]|uniref:Formamidopyrimidine-DNA glycosylase n=1 Tax=Solidesulfovibrio carbinoliphilus subsp. oakridgensis TaxID=694327 RepID=G7Q7I9_9BACT|nr:bifunctional DNA-formamidopyrimidine glycosylase/DNA-(apurinic or apyrimidinic site) lyase [Solidesulfovibrio carbinoliphilus]EHJ47142.1 formamidopyrimidine-DNA glycosylase [Solidesulfovibrio carbinoliphilus subsp. oakridgensis]